MHPKNAILERIGRLERQHRRFKREGLTVIDQTSKKTIDTVWSASIVQQAANMNRNTSRVYRPELQADQSRRLRNHADPTWDGFHRLWTAFNALYNAAEGREERDRVRSVVSLFLAEPTASELLQRLLPPISEVPDPPPGDTRFEENDPRFRARSEQELAVVHDPHRPAN